MKSYSKLLQKSGFRIELVAEVDIGKLQEDLAQHRVLAAIPCHSFPPKDYYSVFYVGKHIVTEQGAIDFLEKKFRHLKESLAK